MPFPGKRLVAIVTGLLVAAIVVGLPYVRTAAFLLDLAGRTDGVRAWIPITPVPVTSRDERVHTRHGDVPVRIYEPTAPAPPTVVVFPGVHGGGLEAVRLTRLCQQLSASALRVICAPLPDLRRFVVSSRSTDMIEDITAWASDASWRSRSSRVTLVGVSFAGGLAVVAAGRERLRDRLNAVVSIGGHGDLTRTLRFLATGVLPDGSLRTPHDYPLAIIALTLAPKLVPPEQVTGLEDLIRTFLNASLDDGSGLAHGQPTIERLRRELEALPEPSRGLARAIVERDVTTTGRAVAPWLDELGADPGLSPALAPLPNAPVFLVHGTNDNVIPSTETPQLAADFARRSSASVHWLLTSSVSHAQMNMNAQVSELWRLIRFWRDARRAVDP